MEPNKEGFSFTYSAKEQDEVKRIREKYIPETEAEDKMTRLRRLDASVTKKGTVWSVIVGVIGTLIMGSGMSMAMVAGGDWFILGVILGVAGIAVLSVAYPLYTAITRRERARITPEILRLTEELMK
ncbi:MAG: hypothetical protein IJX72_01460 [Clostridia bacterium]|nr:hypothetical protein [Clostridia bacterium]